MGYRIFILICAFYSGCWHANIHAHTFHNAHTVNDTLFDVHTFANKNSVVHAVPYAHPVVHPFTNANKQPNGESDDFTDTQRNAEHNPYRLTIPNMDADLHKFPVANAYGNSAVGNGHEYADADDYINVDKYSNELPDIYGHTDNYAYMDEHRNANMEPHGYPKLDVDGHANGYAHGNTDRNVLIYADRNSKRHAHSHRDTKHNDFTNFDVDAYGQSNANTSSGSYEYIQGNLVAKE